MRVPDGIPIFAPSPACFNPAQAAWPPAACSAPSPCRRAAPVRGCGVPSRFGLPGFRLTRRPRAGMAGRRIAAKPAARAVRVARVAAMARCGAGCARYLCRVCPLSRRCAPEQRQADLRLQLAAQGPHRAGHLLPGLDRCARRAHGSPHALRTPPSATLTLPPAPAPQCRPTSPSRASAASPCSACSWAPSAPTWFVPLHHSFPQRRVTRFTRACCRSGAAPRLRAAPSRACGSRHIASAAACAASARRLPPGRGRASPSALPGGWSRRNSACRPDRRRAACARAPTAPNAVCAAARGCSASALGVGGTRLTQHRSCVACAGALADRPGAGRQVLAVPCVPRVVHRSSPPACADARSFALALQ